MQRNKPPNTFPFPNKTLKLGMTKAFFYDKYCPENTKGLRKYEILRATIMAAIQDAQQREAAIMTFLVAASGLTLFGIGAAFWGLIAGGAMLALARLPISR